METKTANGDTHISNNSNISTPSSVRSSSNKGQFSRYKNMFDSLLRNKSREKYKQQMLLADASTTLLPNQLSTNQLANFIKKLDIKNENSPGQTSILHMPLSDDEKSSHILNPSSHLHHSCMSSSFSIDESESTRNSSTLAAVFYGVSDETSSMLNSIISGNEQIAEFFDKPLHSLSATTTTTTTSTSNNNISILKQNGEYETPGKASSSENIDTLYSSVYSSSVSSLSPSSKSSSETSANNDAVKSWNQRPVSLERSKVILNNQKRVDLNKSHFEKANMMNSNENSAVTTLSSINSLSDIFSVTNFELNLNSIFLDMNDVEIQHEDQNEENRKTTTTNSIAETSQISSLASTTTTNHQPKCESVYFELDEFDFSSDDDSYETESNEYDGESCEKLNETDSLHSNKIENYKHNKRLEQEPSPAPPKPKRTFEHDVYVHLKEEDKLKTTMNKNDVNSNNTNKNRTFRNNQAKSMYNENVTQLNEHIYETLPSIRDFNNNDATSQAALNNNKLENKFTSITNVSNKPTKNDVITRKLRLNNLNDNKNMVRKIAYLFKIFFIKLVTFKMDFYLKS